MVKANVNLAEKNEFATHSVQMRLAMLENTKNRTFPKISDKKVYDCRGKVPLVTCKSSTSGVVRFSSGGEAFKTKKNKFESFSVEMKKSRTWRTSNFDGIDLLNKRL